MEWETKVGIDGGRRMEFDAPEGTEGVLILGRGPILCDLVNFSLDKALTGDGQNLAAWAVSKEKATKDKACRVIWPMAKKALWRIRDDMVAAGVLSPEEASKDFKMAPKEMAERLEEAGSVYCNFEVGRYKEDGQKTSKLAAQGIVTEAQAEKIKANLPADEEDVDDLDGI